eukprot:5269072-Lingulodinium_polyedra.AAC.1
MVAHRGRRLEWASIAAAGPNTAPARTPRAGAASWSSTSSTRCCRSTATRSTTGWRPLQGPAHPGGAGRSRA